MMKTYNSLIRPLRDYGDIMYDQAYNASFCERIVSLQYNTGLTINIVNRTTVRDRLYQEIGLKFGRDTGIENFATFWRILEKIHLINECYYCCIK